MKTQTYASIIYFLITLVLYKILDFPENLISEFTYLKSIKCICILILFIWTMFISFSMAQIITHFEEVTKLKTFIEEIHIPQNSSETGWLLLYINQFNRKKEVYDFDIICTGKTKLYLASNRLGDPTEDTLMSVYIFKYKSKNIISIHKYKYF